MLEIINRGGPFMWVLFSFSVLVFAIVLERIYSVRRGRFFKSNSLKTNALKLLTKEGYEKAFVYLREEIEVISRPNIVLSTVASVSPLIGLLGTVSGMIKVFAGISGGALGDPSQLASGISEALLTTAAGLILAIPSFVAFKFFQSRIRLYSVILENTLLENKSK